MDPITIAGLAASVIGTGLQMQSQRSAQKKQQNVINQMAETRRAGTDQILTDIEGDAQRFNPISRAENLQAVQSEKEAQLGADLQRALSPNSKEVPAGKVDPEYLQRVAQNKSQEATRQAGLIRLFAALDAPNSQRFNESLGSADALARRQGIAGATNSTLAGQSAQLNSITPNSGLTTAGGLLGAAGPAVANYGALDKIKVAMTPKPG